MDHQLESFVDDLRATHGRNLAAVIQHGITGHSDGMPSGPELLVALESIGPDDLRNAHAAVREWQRLGHRVPIYFTVSELQNAADVFPIEFRQMSKARRVLYGRDVLQGVEISDRNLRHQVEFELRSRLLRLRREFIPASTSATGLQTLMAESLVSFAIPFCGALLLKGVDPPNEKHAIAAITVSQFELDGTIFEKILNMHEGNYLGEKSDTEANRLFSDYLEQLEKVIDAVDDLDDTGLVGQ